MEEWISTVGRKLNYYLFECTLLQNCSPVIDTDISRDIDRHTLENWSAVDTGGEGTEITAVWTLLCSVGGGQGARAPVTTPWSLPLFYPVTV